MRIWNYHPTTNELLGESVADPNPLEPDEWLLPAFSTSSAPPEPIEGHASVWTGGSWLPTPDHRGEIWWKADAEDNSDPVVVVALGDPTQFETPLTSIEPPAAPVAPVDIIVTPRQIRQALNELGLRAAIEGWVSAADQDTRDNWQFAESFRRRGGLIEAAFEELGEPSETTDAVFELAKAL